MGIQNLSVKTQGPKYFNTNSYLKKHGNFVKHAVLYVHKRAQMHTFHLYLYKKQFILHMSRESSQKKKKKYHKKFLF